MIMTSRASFIEVIKASKSCPIAYVILSLVHEEFQEYISIPNKVSVML